MKTKKFRAGGGAIPNLDSQSESRVQNKKFSFRDIFQATWGSTAEQEKLACNMTSACFESIIENENILTSYNWYIYVVLGNIAILIIIGECKKYSFTENYLGKT